MADEKPPEETPSGAATENTSNSQEGESLEGSGDQPNATGVIQAADADKKPAAPKKGGGIKAIFRRFSIYLLLFVLVVVLAIMVIAISYIRSHSKQPSNVTNQTLSQNSLNQLSKSDVTVGDVKQTLNVQSNAVFAGQVLVRKDLQVAGKLQVGGSLSLADLNVSGTGLFGEIQTSKNLQVAGDTSLQGQLTVQKNLQVNGTGTFNGAISAPQITVSTLQISGDLTLTHHINAGGVTPGRSNGNALGGGGTASVSGSDTAGSITINTGGSPSAGCFITVTFSQKFNATPHVVVTPIEAAAASLQYYVTRNTTSFSVCSANAAPGGSTFGFDYIVFD